MLSKKQKIAYFKERVIENYRSSLSLEGLPVRKITNIKKISDLKSKYTQPIPCREG